MTVGEIIEALKIIDGLGKQIASTWEKIKAHGEEVEDEEKRAKILDAVARRDADFIRQHMFV